MESAVKILSRTVFFFHTPTYSVGVHTVYPSGLLLSTVFFFQHFLSCFFVHLSYSSCIFFRRQLIFFIFYLYFIIFLESNLLLPLSSIFFLFPLILISFCPFLVSSPFLLLPSLFSSFVIPPRLQRSKSFPSVKVSLFTVSRVHGHTFAHYIFLHSFLPRLLLPLIQCIYSTHSPSSYSARIPLLFPLISSLFLNKKLL